jgi:hypothetical protein
MEDSVKDYISIINSDYYVGALSTDSPDEYLEYVVNKGYANESALSMWLGVIDIYDLKTLDEIN